MKTISLMMLAMCCLLMNASVYSQQDRVLKPQRGKVKKDSLQIGCLLLQPHYEADDEEVNILGEKELKLVVSSASDTTVKAPWDLTVSAVKRLEDGRYEIVAFHQDFWFWFSGIDKARTYKGQQLKKGDALGLLDPGNKVELLVYDFETPVDPKKYLQCK